MDNNWQDIYDICYNAFQTNPASYFWSIMTISVCYFGLVMGVKQWCTKKPQQNKRKRDSFFPISPDNTVYLTRFHFQSWFLLLPLSVLHGMMTYFSHLINLICLFLCLGQIYEYNDFRSFPSLFIFASLHAVMESYEQMSKFKTQKKINLVPVLKFIDDVHSQKVTVAQYSLHKGDHIPLSSKCNSIVPADVVLIRGQVFVDEQEFTGERIVVCKNRIPIGGDKDSENSEDRDHVVFRGTRIVDRVALVESFEQEMIVKCIEPVIMCKNRPMGSKTRLCWYRFAICICSCYYLPLDL